MINNKDNVLPSLWVNACKYIEHSMTVSENYYEKDQTTPKEVIKCFYCKKIPNISIIRYADRIHKYSKCSESCIVMALIYIDRFLKKSTQITLNPQSIHRLLLTAIVLAIKFSDDIFYANQHYSKIGGINCRELNLMESSFLKGIDYSLYILPDTFNEYKRNLKMLHIENTKDNNKD